MKRIILSLILVLTCISAHAATWYVRTDGGTAAQCTGHADTPYGGSGTAQPCAVNHPFWLLDQNAWTWKIAGGDTVQFGDVGPYYIGQTLNGLGQTWPHCAGNVPACGLPANIPGGTSANPTRILGANAGNCHTESHSGLTAPTVLSGLNKVFWIMSLQGSVWLDMECIDITQPDTCTVIGVGGSNITNTAMNAGTATFSWTTGWGNPPLVGQAVTITGTTNGGGAFNVVNKRVASVNSSGPGTFTITGLSGTFPPQQESGIVQPTGICAQGTNNYATIGLAMAYLTGQGPINLTMRDIGIHGISGTGILGSHFNLTAADTFTASDIYLDGNGNAGWDSDGGGCGISCESIGTMNISYVSSMWNGCMEVKGGAVGANGHNYCVDQQYGGNGDGLVMVASKGTWNWSHIVTKWNTQDGFDSLHVGDDLANLPDLNMSYVYAEGNEGQSIKGGGKNVTLRNSVAIANCNVLSDASNFPMNPAGWNAALGMPCRANDAIAMAMADGDTLTIENVTNVSEQSVSWDIAPAGAGTCTTNCIVTFTNNSTVGFVSPTYNVYAGGVYTAGLRADPFANPSSSISYNAWYHTGPSGATCPSESTYEKNYICADPLFVGESNINLFNPALTSSSPLKGVGQSIGTVVDDFLGRLRPNPPSIGAMEFAASTATTPSQVALSTTPASAIVGQAVTFTANVATVSGVVPTGSVNFSNGATPLGTAILNGTGVATFSTSSLASGSYSLTASYAGDSHYRSGASAATSLTVSAPQAASTVTLSVTPKPATVGQSVTLVGTVATISGKIPTGSVAFMNGSAVLARGTLNSAGVASFSTSSLVAGTYAVTVSYAGDANYLSGASGATSLVVSAAKSASSVALGVTPKPATVGQAVAFTGTVATLKGVVPTGAVTFLNGGVSIGTGTLNGAGVASFSTSSLAAGTYAVTVSYAGDANYLSGVSGATSLVVSAAKSASSVALGVTPKPAKVGQAVAFTATVATLKGIVPTGAVTFLNGGASIGTGTLNGAGVASFSTSSLVAGTYAVTVSYAGDTNYLSGASGATSLVVNPAKSAATVMLGVASNPSIAGRPVSLTASVNTTNGVAATGTVIFTSGMKTLGTATLNGSGTATAATAALAAGTYSVTAAYAGDANYNAGSSSAVSLTVKAGISPSQTALTASPNKLKAGQTAALTAKVAAVSGLQPTGTVTFMNGMKTFGTSTLGGDGVATLTTAKLSAATYSLTAAYSGDTNYSPSTSNAAALTVSSDTSVSISVAQPEFGFNVIPGSTRRLFASVTNGSTGQALWTVKSGTATLGSASGAWVDVVAPATGAACTYANNGTDYTVTSATTFTVEAVSVDDSTQKADVTFNVCNPKVQVAVVPFYRTLYKNQPADMQSLVLGSVNANVHWTISSQPMGGDGKLGDSTSRDTVFAASVAGRYTLTATSQADTAKTATAILYVTANAVPYTNPVTPNMTVPVDCTVDPAMAGTVYEVGPSQAFHTLASVPFPTMPAGSTVRVHNEDTTGLHATEYHEYVQIAQQATAAQPIRICGVPDTTGNLPILDGSAATGRSDDSSAIAGLGLITLHNDASTKAWPEYSAAAYIVVEGLHLRNAKKGFSYMSSNGSSSAWTETSACVRVNQGQNTAFIGNDLDNCGTGAMSAWNKDGGWGSSNLNALWEGNHVHSNGVAGSSTAHQMDLQAWGEVVQFNRIDGSTAGSLGANLKSRGLQSVIRYNFLADGPARQMDLVDVKAGATYMSFSGFLEGGSSSYHAANPSDGYTADQLAAAQEAWNSHFVYGNIYQNAVSMAPIHFGMDTAGGELARKGSLYWYNNTFYQKACSSNCSTPLTMFDTTAGDGNFLTQVEFPTVQSFNNVIWMDDVTKPTFQWNNSSTFIGVSGKNLLPANWGTNAVTGGAGSGWSTSTSTSDYQNSTDLAAHLTGFTSSNLATTSSVPFDTTSWALGADVAGSSVVPDAVCEMPARFAYLPSLGYAISRIATANLGATDTVAEMGAQMTSVRGVSRYNSHYSNCR